MSSVLAPPPAEAGEASPNPNYEVAVVDSFIPEPLTPPPAPPSKRFRLRLPRGRGGRIAVTVIAAVALFGAGVGAGQGVSGAASYQAQLSTANQKNTVLESANSTLKSGSQGLEHEIATLTSQLSALQSQNDSLSGENSDLSDQLTSLQAKLDRQSQNAPPANNAPGISIDLAQWDGLFLIKNTTLTYEFGYADVLGTIEYLGGADCDPSYVEVAATFYRDGKIVGQGLWNTLTISAHHAVPLDVSGSVSGGRPTKVEVVMTEANC